MNIHSIKAANRDAGFYFFSPDTLKFFGDKVTSFGVKKWRGDYIVYRKPSATIKNVHGDRVRSGKAHFVAYKFNEATGDLSPLCNEDKEAFWKEI